MHWLEGDGMSINHTVLFPRGWSYLTESYYCTDEKGLEVIFFQLPILQGIPSVSSV